MKIKKSVLSSWFFVLIIFVASFLRLWNLGNNPPHLTPDEASLGYNAYSILKTARDEYGDFLPIIFKSFGDYKPGFYVYLTIPFVAILGLTEFAVRLPSALAGIFAVWLLYKITNIIFQNKKFEIWNLKFGIWPAILLAISPWHIYFSRGAWEANVSLTLTLAGVYFFLKSLKSSKFFVVCSLFFALTLLTYQGAKLSTLIVIVILGVLYWKEIFKFEKKFIIGSSALFALIALPILLSFFNGKATRLNIFNVFSYPRPYEYTQNFLDQGGEKIGNLNYFLFHSETLNFTRGIMGRWFNHFSGRFLFFEGDYQNPLHSAPNHGMLYVFDIVLLVCGFVAISKIGLKKEILFVLLWLILAPLPGALSRDQVQAVRALNMIIPLTIISSLGAVQIMNLIRSFHVKVFSILCSVFLVFLLFSSLVYYFDSYFVHLPKHNSKYWSYGYKQVVEAITQIQDKYETIKIQQSFAQPYIYFLFYTKYDPAKYQRQANLVESEYKGDVRYIERLDNIYFSQIDWSRDRKEENTLVIADPLQVPSKDSSDEDPFKLIKEIKYLNGEIAFRMVEVK